MTLGELIKKSGRTQKWVRERLAERGASRSTSYFNRMCNGRYTPRDDYIFLQLGLILGTTKEEVKKCFTKKTNNGESDS